MVGPRDPSPVNSITGQPLSDAQVARLQKLTDAGEVLYDAMHFCEGSVPPGEHQEHHFQTRRMNLAATNLETALMYARKATLESP